MVVRLGEGARVINCRKEVITTEETWIEESGYLEIDHCREHYDSSSSAFIASDPNLETFILRELLLIAEQPPQQIECDESEECKEHEDSDDSTAP